MSDIAFLLIVFFIVTTTYLVKEGLFISLPAEESKPKLVLRKNLLTLTLTEKNNLLLNDSPLAWEKLSLTLKQEKKANRKLCCLFRISPQANYGLVIRVLDCLRQAQIYQVALVEMKK
jgi:biopolymer transport protein ExbD